MNYNSIYRKHPKKNYDSAWIKKGRSSSSKRANRMSKTRSKRFLDKISNLILSNMKKTQSKKLTKRAWRNKRAKEIRKLLKNNLRKVSAKAIHHL